MNTGVLLGVTIGVIVFAILKTTCIIYIWRRRSRGDSSRILKSNSSTGSGVANAAELLAYLEKWEIRCDDVKIVKRPNGTDWELGSGAFGRVVKGLRAGVQEVAIKMLFQTDQKAQESFLREISMLKFASRDRNVVQFYGVSIQNNGIWLITEHMEGGDLRNALTSEGEERVTWWNKGKQIACDVARGLAFLHSNKIIHRDLKSKNVLLTKDGQAKITDVGMAKLMSEAYFTQDASFGTFSWAAPEVLLGERCSEKVDCYSLGVTCWEIATGLMPVRGHLTPPTKEECPREVAKLIADLMRRDPHSRPSAASAYRRLKACEPNPEILPETTESIEFPKQSALLAAIKERETGGLTWNSSVKDIDSAGEATAVDLQSEPETLLRLAEGASHKVTLIENSNTQLPLQGEGSPSGSLATKESAVLMQLAKGASTKLNAIDNEDQIVDPPNQNGGVAAADPPSGGSKDPAVARSKGLPLSPEMARAIDMEDGFATPKPRTPARVRFADPDSAEEVRLDVQPEEPEAGDDNHV